MANSKFEYVRQFERDDALLPNAWLVVRIDGRGFHKFSTRYEFTKPNDKAALELMNESAQAVVKALPDIAVAYGQSDEYSFVFQPSTALFDRREAKIVTTVVSIFTASYIHLWPKKFPNSALEAPLPTFDGRAVLYPSLKNIRDYLSWRQVDCHINNLYNSTFWALVNSGRMTTQKAEQRLVGTFSKDKHEILFSQFGINYNNEPEMFKKGSVIYRNMQPEKSEDGLSSNHNDTEGGGQNPRTASAGEPLSKKQQEKEKKLKLKAKLEIEHTDIIEDEFWKARPWILAGGDSTT